MSLWRTERRRLSAGCMILTAGAWAVPALGELGVEMKVLRKLLFWYGGQGVEEYRREVLSVLLHRCRKRVGTHLRLSCYRRVGVEDNRAQHLP